MKVPAFAMLVIACCHSPDSYRDQRSEFYSTIFVCNHKEHNAFENCGYIPYNRLKP